MPTAVNNNDEPRFIAVDDGTIHDQSPGRARKRIRGEESQVEEAEVAMPVEDTKVVIDEIYNREDGDCFVRVQDTLFKVHSERLVMSPIIAGKLASLKTSWMSRDTPLRLYGVDSDEFRALMWARYASHDDVKDQPKNHVDLLRLLHLATITRGYDFKELHAWTIKAIYNAFTADPPKLPSCSSDLFQKMVEVSKECKTQDLLDAVVSKWIEAVKKKEVSPLPAIKAADMYRLRGLRGIAYYTYLQERLKEAKETHNEESTQNPTLPFQLELNSKLNSKQQLSLLAGHISLSKFWEKRRRTPTVPPRSSPCTSHDKCIDTWLARWRNAGWTDRVQDLHSSDVLAILAAMCQIMEEDKEVQKELTAECREATFGAVREELCDLRLALNEHFATSRAS